MEEIQYLSRAEVLRLQWERLEKLLRHAYETCPFYRKRFDDAGLSPKDVQIPKDLKKLPILTKTEIQGHYREMISRAYHEKDLIRDKTGGSTGSPLVFYYQRDRLDTRQAAAVRHNRWAGWDFGVKVGWIWGAYSDLEGFNRFKSRLRNRLLSRNLILDTSAMTELNIDSYIDKLRRYNPAVLLAYTNSLALLAKRMKDKGVTDIRPKGIIGTCEVLTPENRILIESVFGCKIFDRYGSREVAVIASECEYHEGMHINADNLFLEFTKEGKNVSPRENGEVLITDLMNYGMPLVRYKIEDMGAPSDRVCKCGRGLPLMEMMAGRVTDFIVTPKGKIVSGVALATYMITNIEGIQQVRLLQDEPDALKILLIKGEKFSPETERVLLERARKFLDDSLRLKIVFVDELPKSSSGKSLFSISNVRF